MRNRIIAVWCLTCCVKLTRQFGLSKHSWLLVIGTLQIATELAQRGSIHRKKPGEAATFQQMGPAMNPAKSYSRGLSGLLRNPEG